MTEQEMKDEAFELLDRLKPEIDDLDERSSEFVADMLRRRDQYGDDMRVSRRQVFWLRDLAERHA